MKILRSNKNLISYWVEVSIEHEGEKYSLHYHIENGEFKNNPYTSKLIYFDLPEYVKNKHWDSISEHIQKKYRVKIKK